MKVSNYIYSKPENNSLTWNVFYNDFNSKVIEIVNIFELSGNFMRGFKTIYKKCKGLTEEFFQMLKAELQYSYWCKVEYEILITPVICRDPIVEKVDIYTQVLLNWDGFVAYLLANEPLVKKYVKQK